MLSSEWKKNCKKRAKRVVKRWRQMQKNNYEGILQQWLSTPGVANDSSRVTKKNEKKNGFFI